MAFAASHEGVEALCAWGEPIDRARFVDARRAEALRGMGISTIGALVHNYPRRYLDLTSMANLADVPIAGDATVVGRVHSIKVKKVRPKLTIVEVALVDGTGALLGVWFNQPYMAQRFVEGERVAFAGTVEFDFGMKQIKNPFVEKLGEESEPGDLASVIPLHPATEHVSTNWMRRLVSAALEDVGNVPDPLPVALRVRQNVQPLAAALHSIHFPSSMAQAENARRRLAYQEAFVFQCILALRRHHNVEERSGVVHVTDGEHMGALPDRLPFDLTADQETAVQEILADMAGEHPMNRMLLGDVGTGKTAVAAHGLCAAADTHGQAAMMAPTEVLAQQYALAVGPLLDGCAVSWAELTGSTPAAERSRILAELASGTLSVVFGTHALLQADVVFERLTLAVVDEQHRFGVDQRLALRGKGKTPDLLVMSATPIPRTLALTLYGDLAVSTLRSRPRADSVEAVRTSIVGATEREQAYGHVHTEVAAGRQAYVVCALVEESTEAQAKAANDEAERLAREVFPELRVGLLTGRMRPADKSAVMNEFRSGELDILVSTTVIEVGVDVPGATVMIVEDAERFGLAQLHQLRGRIGRGDHAGHFYLFADPATDDGRARMDAIATISDGFELAEADLVLRGEGDILGSRQSGLPRLRLVSLTDDLELIESARADATSLIASDPHLTRAEHRPLALLIAEEAGDALAWVDSG